MCPAFISNCIVIMQMHFTHVPYIPPLSLSQSLSLTLTAFQLDRFSIHMIYLFIQTCYLHLIWQCV